MPEEAPTTTPTAPTATPPAGEWISKADHDRITSDLRAEAAGYRVRLRDTEAKFKDAKTPEEFAAATKELTEANAKLTRDLEVATATKGLPDELVAVVASSTATGDELKALIEGLRKFAPQPAPPKEGGEEEDESLPNPADLRGGLTPNERHDAFDPVDIAKQIVSGAF